MPTIQRPLSRATLIRALLDAGVDESVANAIVDDMSAWRVSEQQWRNLCEKRRRLTVLEADRRPSARRRVRALRQSIDHLERRLADFDPSETRIAALRRIMSRHGVDCPRLLTDD